jgi:hypothetical protein
MELEMSLLDVPFLLETRRNHALEHATLKILSPKYPNLPLGGHSNPTGFMIIGDVYMDDLETAADEALQRLRAGERGLAIHPGCGTNYATSGLLAGSLAWFGMKGKGAWHKKLWRIPFIFPLVIFVWVLSKPLGPKLQDKVTTEANPGDMEIVSVKRIRPSLHRIVTR